MQNRKNSWQQSIVALLILVLAVVMVGVMEPGAAQAANFGGLTDNGTARFMGIGTNYNTSRNLHVVGSPLFERAVDTAGFLIKRTAANRWFLGVNENPLIGYGFVISTFPEGAGSSTPRVLVTQDGLVGINTISPDSSSQLTVYRSGGKSVYGWNTSGDGVSGESTNGYGVYGYSANSDGVHGSSGSSGSGVYGYHSSGNQGNIGTSTSGLYGYSASNYGVSGVTSSGTGVSGGCVNGYGVYGSHSNSGNYGYIGDSSYGVYGISVGGMGMRGDSTSNVGVYGGSTSGVGVRGSSSTSSGVYGVSTSGYGISGESSSGWAGYFTGSVYVTGNITAASKPFRIDHPLDPENKYLYHNAIESPDMKNVYDGTILLDNMGRATVELPSYFNALNRDFRYQLTCIGEPAVLYIAEEISSNHFKIAGGKPGMKVSWQVTGIRQDAYANAHPIAVEQEKSASEKGYYLHPVEWGQPKEKSIDQAPKP